ncbi:MAG: T9SS type A sorting domain-containing protein [Bacteroidia bacterium]
MIKQFSFIYLIFSSIVTFAQTNLTVNHLPQIGDHIKYKAINHLDTALIIGSAGNNQTWDMTSLAGTFSYQTEQRYISPSQSPSANLFAGTNLCQIGVNGTDTIYNHFTKNSTQFTALGWYFTGGIYQTYTNSEQWLQLPLNYGDSFSDSSKYTTSFSTTVTRHRSVKLDGKGTLILPDGLTLSPVFRVKTIFYELSSANPIPTQQVMYDWYAPQIKNVAMSFVYRTDDLNNTTWKYLDTIPQNVPVLPPSNGQNFHLYPNPCQDYCQIEGKSSLENLPFYLFNVEGKMIDKQEITAFPYKIDMRQYPAGMYWYEIAGQRGKILVR